MKKSIYIALALVAVLVAGGWLLFNTYLEFEKPQIKLAKEISAVGPQSIVGISFSDGKSGLRNASVTITQNGKTSTVAAVNFSGRGKHNHALSLPIDAAALKLQNGPAEINISAVDYSLLKNKTETSRKVTIDYVPPQISLYNPVNHINPGGTCVIVYRVMEPVTMSGVEVGNDFFKGYPILIGGKPFEICYFALPVDVKTRGAQVRLVATDNAGNKASISVPYLLMARKFRSDKMETSENFLQQKMPEFQNMELSLRGKSLLDTFIHVNTKMREDNAKTIRTACAVSAPQPLWEGTFLRMKNGKPMALFGDKRTYLSGGKNVGESVHLGVDLASTQQAPIEASNSGVVIFAGPIGIYGNTVIIDHGLGLSSLYAHLSSITTQKGAQVKKGDVIGHSGMSGLAGGDHLHFSILVGGQFVDPREWWDPHWIQDNVLKKMAVSY